MNYIICALNIDNEIYENLSKLGVTPVKLHGFEKFGKFHPLSYHPDMFCFNLESNKWLFYEEIYEINKDIINKLNLDITIIENPASCEYPHDTGLNAAMFGDNLICNARHTNPKIIEYARQAGKNIIDVKQGYAKCSVCIVDENSIITSDVSIYSKASRHKIDVLLIEKGHINLDGYNYGFIGGCSGLVNSDKLAFTGNIELHPDYHNIKNFCEGRGVETVSLSHKKLYDYGSLFKI